MFFFLLSVYVFWYRFCGCVTGTFSSCSFCSKVEQRSQRLLALMAQSILNMLCGIFRLILHFGLLLVVLHISNVKAWLPMSPEKRLLVSDSWKIGYQAKWQLRFSFHGIVSIDSRSHESHHLFELKCGNQIHDYLSPCVACKLLLRLWQGRYATWLWMNLMIN